MNINIRTIPQSEHRYETIGDYWFTGDKDVNGGDLEVRVSDVGDWRMEFLVAIHEMVEVAQLKHLGVSEPKIMAFDQWFESTREQRGGDMDSEPGDHPDAPYRLQHRFSENIERIVAEKLGVDWDAYDAHLTKIWHDKQQSKELGET